MFRFRNYKELLSPLRQRISVLNFNTQPNRSANMKSEEVRIDVPWGHVAGKWYGPNNIRPVLMLHGWQDNAGTFDTLIPLLPREFSYLSIDLPGHGLSSRLPHGMNYTALNYIQVLNHIQQHYKWDQVSLCSHSMGALISGYYASLYPARCDLLICLDAIMKPYKGSLENKIQLISTFGEEFIALDKLNRLDKEPPTYAYDELIERWAKQANMTREGVEHLAKRGVFQSKNDPNRFFFTRDIRLKAIDFGTASIGDDIHYKLIERITAPHLFIKAGKSTDYEGADGYLRAVDILKASNPKFEWVCVDGGHHCHLTEPTLVSEYISNFIIKYRLQSLQIKHKI